LKIYPYIIRKRTRVSRKRTDVRENKKKKGPAQKAEALFLWCGKGEEKMEVRQGSI
jgi:hypothetical protein